MSPGSLLDRDSGRNLSDCVIFEDIDADTAYDCIDDSGFADYFGKEAADFFSMDVNIIRPLYTCFNTESFIDGFRNCQRDEQIETDDIRNRYIRPEHKRYVYTRPAGRIPAPVKAAPPFCLFFGNHHESIV